MGWIKRKLWWFPKYRIVKHDELGRPCVNCDGRHLCEDGVRDCPCKWSYQHLKKNW